MADQRKSFSLTPNPNGKSVIPPNTTGFTSPALKKGRITNVRTRYFREFMFNPSTLSSTDGWEYGDHTVAGASHPVQGGGHGKKRGITFSLYLDAERGRLEKRSTGATTSTFEVKQANKLAPTSFDLTEELNFYKSFTFPSNPIRSGTLADRGPARAILTFGSMYQGTEVLIEEVHIEILMFTPDLKPMRATVALTFSEYMQRPVQASRIFSDPLDNGSTLGGSGLDGDGT